MTENQLDIFAEIAPPEVAQYVPGSLWQCDFFVPQHVEHIQGEGSSKAELLAAYTGQHWVGGFRMSMSEAGKLLYALEIMPGAVMMQHGCRLPLPSNPITGLTRPGVLADAAMTLAHAMTGYEDERLMPLMQALDEFRRREVVRL